MTENKTYELADVEAGRIGNLVPAYHIRFPPAEAERLKAEAKKRGRSLPLTKYTSSAAEGSAWWERAFLAQRGLMVLAEHYGVLAKGSPRIWEVRLLPLPGHESVVLLALPKSLRHRDLQRYDREGRELFIPWPVDRRRIGDYSVARSVMTNPDGSSSVFVWGCISKDAIHEALETRRRYPPRERGGSSYIRLRLGDYDPDLLLWLIERQSGWSIPSPVRE